MRESKSSLQADQKLFKTMVTFLTDEWIRSH